MVVPLQPATADPACGKQNDTDDNQQLWISPGAGHGRNAGERYSGIDTTLVARPRAVLPAVAALLEDVAAAAVAFLAPVLPLVVAIGVSPGGGGEPPRWSRHRWGWSGRPAPPRVSGRRTRRRHSPSQSDPQRLGRSR